ncbi:MAG: DUF1653 domain-containing protein [bacterium]
MTKPKPNQIYKHYKSTPDKPMFYQIIGIAKHTETDQLMVVYKPLYTSNWLEKAEFATRPLEMFLQKVMVDGKEIARFELVESKYNSL